MCAFSQSVMLTRLLSSLQFYKATRRWVSVRNIVRDSEGPKSGFISITHVPSRTMCRAAPVSTVICFCTHLTANTVSPQDQPMQQHTSSPTTIPPEAKANHTVPASPQESPCLSLSTPHRRSRTDSIQCQMRVYELPQNLFYINKERENQREREREKKKREKKRKHDVKVLFFLSHG